MTQVFFDDSHHQRGEFSLGAFVFFGHDPTSAVEDAITRVGLVPGRDEYKSRQPHATDPRWRDLRDSLFGLTCEAKVGIVVAPYSDRARLGAHALHAMAHILSSNEIERPITVFLDEGLFRSARQLAQWRREASLPESVELVAECDSTTTPGIQIADLVAHACAVALLGSMGVFDKTLHDEEEGEYQLSFEMWARLRYNFFSHPLTDPELRHAAHAGLVDSQSGLYVARGCIPQVVEAAQARFGRTWLGCIH